jgi:hypothetical protein
MLQATFYPANCVLPGPVHAVSLAHKHQSYARYPRPVPPFAAPTCHNASVVVRGHVKSERCGGLRLLMCAFTTRQAQSVTDL